MNKDMKRFHRRVVRSAVIKSALAALTVAGGVLFVSAFASWIAGFRNGLWLSLGLFFGVFCAAALVFYFVKYRPTAKAVARRIDELGLEERIITRMELEGDDSYMAKLQREDAERALKAADHTLIKVAASVALIVAVNIAAILGAGALTVDSLYTAGVIPSGVQAVAERLEQHDFKLTYSVPQTGGKIYFWEDNAIGEEVTETIVVREGEDAPAVIVVPDDGYAFTGWTDGLYDPFRQDKEVSHNVSVRARFSPIGLPDDLMDDSTASEEGDEQPGSGEPDPDAPPKDSPERPQTVGGGDHTAANKQVNNGSTYYGDEYGNAYDDAMGRLGEGSELPDNVQGGISDYLDAIGKSGSGEGEGEGEGEGSDTGSGGN